MLETICNPLSHAPSRRAMCPHLPLRGLLPTPMSVRIVDRAKRGRSFSCRVVTVGPCLALACDA